VRVAAAFNFSATSVCCDAIVRFRAKPSFVYQ
jgi:hypothetical protein